jgi:hypothetical protein
MFKPNTILKFNHKRIPDVMECSGQVEGTSDNKVKFSWVVPQECEGAWISDMSDIQIIGRNSNLPSRDGGKRRRTRRCKQSKRR